MFVEEPVVPTSANDSLASLSILHPEKDRKQCFPLLLMRERAFKWTFGTIPDAGVGGGGWREKSSEE